MRSVKLPHESRAQIAGVLRRSCPYCGYIQDHKVMRETWKVRCKNKHCAREMGLGLVFYVLDNPRKRGRTIPPDTVIPGKVGEFLPGAHSSFPQRECRQYVDASPVHQLVSVTGD